MRAVIVLLSFAAATLAGIPWEPEPRDQGIIVHLLFAILQLFIRWHKGLILKL